MPTLDEDGWQLESGVDRHAEAPDTFEIPDEAGPIAVGPDQRREADLHLARRKWPQVERMWVNITGYTEAGYVGVSDNEPRTPGAPIALGKPSTSVLA
jgi:hypothetical protein